MHFPFGGCLIIIWWMNEWINVPCNVDEGCQEEKARKRIGETYLAYFSSLHHSLLPRGKEWLTYLMTLGKEIESWRLSSFWVLLFSTECSQILSKIILWGLWEGEGNDKLAPLQISMYCCMAFVIGFFQLPCILYFTAHPYWRMYQSFIPSYGQILSHCKDILHFVYPLINW